MLDIGFMEILVLGAIALIVVGPKELPGLLRTVGQYAGKARAMARDFQRTMDDAAREADLGDVADVVKGKNKLPFGNQVVDSLKEFENTVKTEVSDAARAADIVGKDAAPEVEAPAAPKTDAPKTEAPKVETAKVEAPKPASAPAKAAPSGAKAEAKPATEAKSA